MLRMSFRSMAILSAISLAALPGFAMATDPVEAIPKLESDAQGRQTLAVMERHAAAMRTRNVDTILADYGDNPVVMATLFPHTLIGRDALRTAILEVLKIPPMTSSDEVKFLRKEAVGNYGYQIFETNGLSGTETYVVVNNKIVYETANITLKK